MSQIAALRHLAPSIQRDILANKCIHERALRSAARYVNWSEQVRVLERKVR